MRRWGFWFEDHSYTYLKLGAWNTLIIVHCYISIYHYDIHSLLIPLPSLSLIRTLILNNQTTQLFLIMHLLVMHLHPPDK